MFAMVNGMSTVFALAFVAALFLASKGTASPDTECAVVSNIRTLSLTINGKQNSSGDWMSFSISTDSNASENMTIDVKHRVVDCGGQKMINIFGVLRDKSEAGISDNLQFGPKCGTNVVILNDGRTARKINPDDGLNGVVLTSRPLKDEELFEVVLESKGAKFDYSMGIGVTTIKDEILPHLNRVKSGTWMYYGQNAWNNGNKILENYGKNIYELVAGDRVGVRVSRSRALNFYVNGVDQGPVASNIPKNIYGAFELFGSALQVSIV